MLVMAVGPAASQGCSNPGPFAEWLAGVRAEAAAAGLSARALAALDGLTPSPEVLRRDRSQGVFTQHFLEFSGRMVSQDRLDGGRQRLQRHDDLLGRIEARFGVPGAVLVAIWGLETDFGANSGDFASIRALATLAHDCRRPDRFRAELMAALRIVDRGDLSAGEMRGAWAGELGQTQLLPSDYVDHATDFDADGRADVLQSVPDVLASTASLLAAHGWQRGEPWLEEVAVPADLPWAEADLTIRHRRDQWRQWGVLRRDGTALPADAVSAALLLPLGRFGPAFLAYPNFDVFPLWNQSSVYSLTIAYFATRLAGAPRVSQGNDSMKPVSAATIREIQTLLAAAGFDLGRPDGILGLRTRAAIRAVQVRLGLPADSYPTGDLVIRLRQRL